MQDVFAEMGIVKAEAELKTAEARTVPQRIYERDSGRKLLCYVGVVRAEAELK